MSQDKQNLEAQQQEEQQVENQEQTSEKNNGNARQDTVIFINGKPVKVKNSPLFQKKQWVDFRVGDTISVHTIIKEGDKERIQIFEGTVIRIRGEDLNKTFTVRRISHGVGVERTFPYHSPWIADIQIVKRGKVRRSKLYYLRDKVGKAAKIKEVF